MSEIIHRVGIKAKAETVYQALTTQKGLAGWWTRETKATSEEGACLEFRFGGMGPDMSVERLVPNTEVKWRCLRGIPDWVDTELSFSLKEEGDRTFVLFRHSAWRKNSEMMGHCSLKWGTFLMSLKSFLETGQGAPYPMDVAIDS